MKTKFLVVILFSIMTNLFGQNNISETGITINPLINGTLFSPEKADKNTKLIILIAGSGMTDRNGNATGLQTNSYKYFAQSLAQDGIAVYSYDKRIIAQVANGTVDEKSLSFDDFIHDANDVIAYFRLKKSYSKIIIAGHSEGSLIGMNAAVNADAYISIAGAGRTIDEVLLEQIGKNAPTLIEDSKMYLSKLRNGETFDLKNPALSSLFRRSLQPYLISWIKLNPLNDIKKLNIPVLIIAGTKDIQVPVGDAEMLKSAKPDAKLILITNMNHIFKEIKNGDEENRASYDNINLPIMPELTSAVNQFIKSL